jgi:hypothetical protein
MKWSLMTSNEPRRSLSIETKIGEIAAQDFREAQLRGDSVRTVRNGRAIREGRENFKVNSGETSGLPARSRPIPLWMTRARLGCSMRARYKSFQLRQSARWSAKFADSSNRRTTASAEQRRLKA